MKAQRNPLTFVPLMYFLQAIPVALVREVANIVYKDLGVANESIVRWTALVALPWSLQMLFGPLVELSSTRRQWVMRAQFVISAALVVLPFLLRLPAAFELSLGAFLAAAIFSTICNAAMDGFYLLSLKKDDQARYAGAQGTFYRLGTLFAKGFLVFLAGKLMAFSSVEIQPTSGGLAFTVQGTRKVVPSARLTVRAGSLTDEDGHELDPPVKVGPDVADVFFAPDGKLTGSGSTIGNLALENGATISLATEHLPQELSAPLSRRNAWIAVLLLGGLLYTALFFVERRIVPRPEEDILREDASGELKANVLRTVAIVGLGIASYFAANAVVRLVAHAIWSLRDGSPEGPLKGWRLADGAHLFVLRIPGPGIRAEAVQLAISLAAAMALFAYSRRSIRGTPMGDAFGSFFRQPGIASILAFLMFYRFGEAMIMTMSPLFLKDVPTAGGLGLGTDAVGAIKGIVGVFGIVLGGILGGIIVSKVGLRHSIWPIAICMHLPGLLYLWASHTLPAVQVMYGVDFIEQFGYGFGYAGYTIVLQRIAQRGNYRTAHYALGVGVGALFITVAGVLSGVLQSNFGYTGLFLAAVFLALPGLATLLFLPLDEPA